MTTDEILKDITPRMKSAIAKLEEDLSRIRTGRANPAILDGIIVPYYGAKTALREMASISVPEATSILVKPWDRNALGDIETAIRASDLGLSPINDGVAVRLNLPPMTEERRREIVAQVKKAGEETKVALRNIRGDAREKSVAAEKNKEITEDDRYAVEEELNKIIAEMNKIVEKIISDKEAEVMKI